MTRGNQLLEEVALDVIKFTKENKNITIEVVDNFINQKRFEKLFNYLDEISADIKQIREEINEK